jgi:hypothetical protein
MGVRECKNRRREESHFELLRKLNGPEKSVTLIRREETRMSGA